MLPPAGIPRERKGVKLDPGVVADGPEKLDNGRQIQRQTQRKECGQAGVVHQPLLESGQLEGAAEAPAGDTQDAAQRLSGAHQVDKQA